MNYEPAFSGDGNTSAAVSIVIPSLGHARPTTVLGAVADLTSRLRAAFEASRSTSRSSTSGFDTSRLHPLAVRLDAEAASDLRLPLQQIHTTLQSFEGQVLNASATGSVVPNSGTLLTGDGDQSLLLQQAGNSVIASNDKLRLLSLLKERATLQLSEYTTADAVHLAQQLLSKRKDRAASFPVIGDGDTNTAIREVIARLAKECNLEVFSGQDEDLGDGMMLGIEPLSFGSSGLSTSTSAPTKQTITMAGKGIVIDADLVEDRTFEHPVTEEHPVPTRIAAMRFSYGLEGHTDPGIDRMLTRLAEHKQWQYLRDCLWHLSELDRLGTYMQESMSSQSQTVDSGSAWQAAAQPVSYVDPLELMQSLSRELENTFKSELCVHSMRICR